MDHMTCIDQSDCYKSQNEKKNIFEKKNWEGVLEFFALYLLNRVGFM